MIAIAREWYGSVEQSPHTKPTSMGKIHILFLLGKLRYGGNSPYLSQNYSRKQPLCDKALKSFYSNHGHVKFKILKLKSERLTK